MVKPKLKKSDLIWIIPVLALMVLIIFLAKASFSKEICGDGICQSTELVNGSNFCDIDCSDMCTAGATEAEIECSVGWEGVYINLVESGQIDEDWLKETDIIDFSYSELRNLAYTLRRDTVKETVKAIAEWTYFNIAYNEADTFYSCYDVPSSEIFGRKTGVCSTMSKLNIALLRANGIPAYSTTGCFKFETFCKLQQSFLGIPLPKYKSIAVDESGYAPTYGYLHNWVIVPMYDEGVIKDTILESTSGRLYQPDGCINYRSYYVNPNDQLACGLSQFDPNLADCEGW